MNYIIAITTVLGSALAIATFINAVLQYRRKIHLEIFRSYSDRYNNLIPADIYPKWRRAINGQETELVELEPVMVRYLNLVWEEWYLYKNRVIPKELWKIWQPEIKRALASDFARRIMESNDFHFLEKLIDE